jgi:hypothetical protein
MWVLKFSTQLLYFVIFSKILFQNFTQNIFSLIFSPKFILFIFYEFNHMRFLFYIFYIDLLLFEYIFTNKLV